jgi:hypothetical protein
MLRDLKIQFFEPHELQLFDECLQDMPHPGEIIVQQLGRVGFSGAKVFMFFPSGQNSRPYVGKIHTKKGIERERDGLNNAFHCFDEASHKWFMRTKGRHGIIAVPLVGTTVTGSAKPKVVELRDMLFSRRKTPAKTSGSPFTYQDGRLFEVLDSVYRRNCGKALANVSLEERILGDEYQWYLRDNATERLLQTWLGTAAEQDCIEMFGRKLPNPLVSVKRIRATSQLINVSTVHGDLHPSNVVLDDKGIPRLLDFTWCRPGAHVLKDFLVMECSIRFMMLPQHISIAGQEKMNLALLDPDQEEVLRLRHDFESLGVDEETIQQVDRCAKIVCRIRHHAKAACRGEFNIAEYLACQALVLYGLMRIDRYPFGVCARALALISEKLQSLDYFGSHDARLH